MRTGQRSLASRDRLLYAVGIIWRGDRDERLPVIVIGVTSRSQAFLAMAKLPRINRELVGLLRECEREDERASIGHRRWALGFGSALSELFNDEAATVWLTRCATS